MVSADENHPDDLLSGEALEIMRHRTRVILLLDAAERAGVAPLSAARLHAFAYLADVLSPVWDLLPFDGKVLKSAGGPHYPDIQREIDHLVALGLVEIRNLQYLDRPNEGARIDGQYALRFESTHLSQTLAAIGATPSSRALDDRDRIVHAFLVELAGALATLPDDEIDVAATVDATYSDEKIGDASIIDFAQWSSDPQRSNLSAQTAERFRSFLPEGSSLSPGEKIYLYAAYLGRRVHGK